MDYDTEKQLSILCDICGKFFQHKSTFNRHIEHFHRDLSQFECKHCDRSFLRLDNIRRHIKNVHNDALGPSIKRTLPTLDVSPPPFKTKKLTTKLHYSETQSSASYIYQQTSRKGQKPMRWLLNTTDVPTRKVIQDSYPRIRDHELVKKPKTIPLEQP